jgi:8-oxo-dGTP pyrophosphatase MutT (NUDIX family)
MGLRDGDRFTRCEQGHVHWGKYGAAGLLVYHDGHVLLQRRAWWTPGGGTWGLFGGAKHSDEDPATAALRETAEESTLPPSAVKVHGLITEDHGNWAYHTVLGTVPAMIDVYPGSNETLEAAWVPLSTVERMRLFKPFAKTWPRLKDGVRRPVLIVDCANVMGARADGWWKDRAGAAARLRDQLGELAECGTTTLEPFDTAYPDIVLVVEGKARGIGSGATKIEVVDAPGSGDDTIVNLVSEPDPDLRHIVVTADRELRARCQDEGAEVLGPRWLLDQLSRG